GASQYRTGPPTHFLFVAGAACSRRVPGTVPRPPTRSSAAYRSISTIQPTILEWRTSRCSHMTLPWTFSRFDVCPASRHSLHGRNLRRLLCKAAASCTSARSSVRSRPSDLLHDCLVLVRQSSPVVGRHLHPLCNPGLICL